MENWKDRAEVLFFVDGLSIVDISGVVGVSIRSISKHFNKLPHYNSEKKRRKLANSDRKQYHREYERKAKRKALRNSVADAIKRDHATAVKILSRERFF